MPSIRSARADIKTHDRLWLWKFLIRLISAVLAVVVLGMFAWLIAVGDGTYLGNDHSAFFADLSFIPLGTTVVFFAIHVFFLFRKRPLHPGWSVGVDLILVGLYSSFIAFIFTGAYLHWIGFHYYADTSFYKSDTAGGTGFFNGTTTVPGFSPIDGSGSSVSSSPSSDSSSSFSGSSISSSLSSSSDSLNFGFSSPGSSVVLPGVSSSSGSSECLDFSPDHKNCYGNVLDTDYAWASRIINTQIAAASILLALVPLHFSLFVWACVDVERRRRKRRASRVKSMAQEMITEMRRNGDLPPVAQPLLTENAAHDVEAGMASAIHGREARGALTPVTPQGALSPYRDLSPAPVERGYYTGVPPHDGHGALGIVGEHGVEERRVLDLRPNLENSRQHGRAEVDLLYYKHPRHPEPGKQHIRSTAHSASDFSAQSIPSFIPFRSLDHSIIHQHVRRAGADMPFTASARVEIKSHDRLYLWKLGLRLLTAIAAAISIGTAAYVLAVSPGGRLSYYDFLGFSYFVFIPLGITIVFFFIHLIYLAVRKRPIHPGWSVGVDLVLWLLYILFSIVLFFNAYTDWYYAHYGYPNYADDYGSYGDSDSNNNSGPSPSPSPAPTVAFVSRLVDTQFTGTICLLINIALHFVLFVWACVDTDKRRRGRDVRKMAAEVIEGMRARGELPPVAEPSLTGAGEAAMRGPGDVELGVGARGIDAAEGHVPYRDVSPAARYVGHSSTTPEAGRMEEMEEPEGGFRGVGTAM